MLTPPRIGWFLVSTFVNLKTLNLRFVLDCLIDRGPSCLSRGLHSWARVSDEKGKAGEAKDSVECMFLVYLWLECSLSLGNRSLSELFVS